MFVTSLLSVVVALLVIIIGYFKWSFQYWSKRNVPYLAPSIPFGNLGDGIRSKEHFGFSLKRIYDEMKAKGWKHGGIYLFLSPKYFLTDLDYVKNILTKDFQHFVDRSSYSNEEDDPLSAHLAMITGTKWRNLRTKLTPTFTSGKLKMMFQTLVDCEVNLKKQMLEKCEKKEAVDIKDVLACYTTDVIGSVAFGLDCKSFEDKNSPFREYSKKTFEIGTFGALKNTFAMNFPNLAKKLRVTLTPKDVADFYMKVVKDTVEYREKNDYRRNDFMQLLIDMKNNKFVGDDGHNHSLTMNEVAAQSFVFFLAGFETSSTLMTFVLYELSKNQDIQEKLRKEIITVLGRYDNKITYESIKEMKYLNQVIEETLRKYPPAPVIDRRCVKDYKVPDEDLIIEKGISVIIPILGIHHDEEYYPNPQKFDPERFSEENKRSRHHYTYIPFGEGPRNCIGMRFALVQSKVGLSALLRNFKFTLNEKTKEPLQMVSTSIILSVKHGVWLDAQKI